MEKIAARFELGAARVELIVDRWLPPTALQVPGTGVLVATGIRFLAAFLIVLGIVAAMVSLPILTSLAPPRGRW
ncbi:hypothetical protein Ais01nite_02890 [Asanoa ishikariensis]|uniref:Uncharacterized protein n=1 Tax=Asanoa ishikariensis TaxID=137265 RepID=A0A1H3TK58_9ACTN|nr:hypothetical protein [Asanoa ishikariensis]GIF62254.1 hypothetical protein Ais01nite_02890 [Asanoa ishikariensis]SDZ50663.1 hypothetical protein SAMN05421684_5943 [Asanoa ishikariensis]